MAAVSLVDDDGLVSGPHSYDDWIYEAEVVYSQWPVPSEWGPVPYPLEVRFWNGGYFADVHHVYPHQSYPDLESALDAMFGGRARFVGATDQIDTVLSVEEVARRFVLMREYDEPAVVEVNGQKVRFTYEGGTII
jgi:hypothetical protein